MKNKISGKACSNTSIEPNNTKLKFEQLMTELEGGYASKVFPSGAVAIFSVLSCFASNKSHILVTDNVYPPIRALCDEFFKNLGVEIEYFDPLIGTEVEQLIRSDTQLIYCESPGSWTFEVTDIQAIAQVSQRYGIPLAIDNTWATPIFCNPLTLGANIVVHSVSKYLSGHQDLILGVVVSDETYYSRINNQVLTYELTESVGVEDCYLAVRGLQTLSVRVHQIQDTALKVIDWLRSRNEVLAILSPCIPTHPGHDIWTRDFRGTTGVFGVLLKQAYQEHTPSFIEALNIFKLGLGWGGTESLIRIMEVEFTCDHQFLGSSHKILRISIGLERAEALVQDLDLALNVFHNKVSAIC